MNTLLTSEINTFQFNFSLSKFSGRNPLKLSLLIPPPSNLIPVLQSFQENSQISPIPSTVLHLSRIAVFCSLLDCHPDSIHSLFVFSTELWRCAPSPCLPYSFTLLTVLVVTVLAADADNVRINIMSYKYKSMKFIHLDSCVQHWERVPLLFYIFFFFFFRLCFIWTPYFGWIDNSDMFSEASSSQWAQFGLVRWLLAALVGRW